MIANTLNYSCGVSRHLLNLCYALDKEGHNIYVVCGGGNATAEYKKYCKEVFIRPYIQHEKRSVRNFIKSVIFVGRLARKYNARIIHSHTHYAANITWYAAKGTDIRRVQTIHGIFHDPARLTKFRADKYIAVNKNIREHLIANGVDGKSISLVYSGIEVNDRKNTIPRGERLRVGVLSRLIYEKGIDLFIKGVAGLAPEVREKVTFYIAGSGPYSDVLEKMNAENNSGIEILGEIKDTKEVLKHTDIAVIPTRLNTEGMPMSLIEAAAAGCLVITSLFEGVKGVVEDKKDGLVFPAGDEKALRDKLEYAILNYADLIPAAEKLNKKVLNLFDMKKFAEETGKVYWE